jgi:hypothetical protein
VVLRLGLHRVVEFFLSLVVVLVRVEVVVILIPHRLVLLQLLRPNDVGLSIGVLVDGERGLEVVFRWLGVAGVVGVFLAIVVVDSLGLVMVVVDGHGLVFVVVGIVGRVLVVDLEVLGFSPLVLLSPLHHHIGVIALAILVHVRVPHLILAVSSVFSQFMGLRIGVFRF